MGYDDEVADLKGMNMTAKTMSFEEFQKTGVDSPDVSDVSGEDDSGPGRVYLGEYYLQKSEIEPLYYAPLGGGEVYGTLEECERELYEFLVNELCELKEPRVPLSEVQELVLKRLRSTLEENPELRLGQLLDCVMAWPARTECHSLFYIPDNVLANLLRDWEAQEKT